MKIVHLYQMTVASKWYDEPSRCAREYEMHLKAARHGKVRAVRRHLAKRGIPYFQRTIYRRFKRWIPKWQIRARFEREEVEQRSEPTITVETRSMQYRGREWKASPFPSRVLGYAKKRRKRKRSASLPKQDLLKIDKDCVVDTDLEREHVRTALDICANHAIKVLWIKRTDTAHGNHY